MNVDTLRFLIDEDVPVSVGHFLTKRPHPVEYVSEIQRGASDAAVFQMAEDRHAVLITKNKKHFEKLWNRNTSRHARRYLHAGMIYLRLKDQEHLASQRMAECVGLVEYEWSRVQHLEDRKIIIDLRLESILLSR